MDKDNTTKLRALDRNSLNERLMGDKDLVAEVLKVFLEDAPNQIADIRAAFTGADMEKARDAAHSLKGSAGNIGGEKLQAISRSIEEAAREGDNRKLGSLIPELMDAFDGIKAEIDVILSER